MNVLRDNVNGASKNAEIVIELFRPWGELLYKQMEALAYKTAKERGVVNFSWIRVDSIAYYIKNNSLGGVCLTPTENLKAEEETITKALRKAKEDLHFIQMWLTLTMDKDPKKQQAKLPPILLKHFKQYIVSPEISYEIPKGQEEYWHRAEQIISFCLGIKLMV